MIRSWIKCGAARMLSGTGMHRLAGRWSGTGVTPVVIGYHRVVEDFPHSQLNSIPSMLISTRMLEQQLDWIGRKYKFVSPGDLGRAMENGLDVAGMASVTFDDGYRDFYDHALPLLERKGIPAAVFVVSHLVGSLELLDHDRLYLLLSRKFGSVDFDGGAFDCFLRDAETTIQGAPRTVYEATRLLLEGLSQGELRRLIARLMSVVTLDDAEFRPFLSMTWEMIERVRHAGITIGSHTRSHVLMTNENGDRLAEEAAGSRSDIERRLGERVEHFAYPSGCFDHESVAAVARAGYRFAYTVCRHRSRSYPQLTIPRTLLWERSSINSAGGLAGPVLECQMHGAFELVSGCRSMHGAGGRRKYVG